MSDIDLTIDGQGITVPAGTTILQAAQQLKKEIPTICYHPHFYGRHPSAACV